MPKKEALKREPSTGNVFADLGLADAGDHLIKAGLVVRIDRTIRQRKLTQAAAAQLMGIDQPKISAMLAGQFRGYSVIGREERADAAFRSRDGLRYSLVQPPQVQLAFRLGGSILQNRVIEEEAPMGREDHGGAGRSHEFITPAQAVETITRLEFDDGTDDGSRRRGPELPYQAQAKQDNGDEQDGAERQQPALRELLGKRRRRRGLSDRLADLDSGRGAVARLEARVFSCRLRLQRLRLWLWRLPFHRSEERRVGKE